MSIEDVFHFVRCNDLDGLKALFSTDNTINLDQVNLSTHLTPLMLACNRPRSSVKLDMISLLLKNGASVDYMNFIYRCPDSALLKAVNCGDLEVINLFIKHGARVDLKNTSRRSALDICCKKGNVEVTKALLMGKDIWDILISDDTSKIEYIEREHRYSISCCPFNIAVEHKHLELIKWLLENGKVTSVPISALFLAIKNQGNDMVKLLLHYVTQVNPTGDEASVLMLASWLGNCEIVKMLLEKNAKVNFQNSSRVSALMLAASSGNVEVVKQLLEGGADANLIGMDKFALKLAASRGMVEVVKELLDRGADVNLMGVSKESALMIAASQGKVEVVKELLERGADVNLKGWPPRGSTALLRVLLAKDDMPQQTKVAIVKLLLEYGADVKVRDHERQTTLHLAISIQSAEIVKLLLNKDKDLTKQPESPEFRGRGYGTGNYPLYHAAVSQPSPDIVQLLLDAGADTNMQNDIGETPLMFVRDANIAKILISNGANVNLQDNHGVYAMLHALVRKDYKVVEVLLEEGADSTLSVDNEEPAIMKYSKQILADCKKQPQPELTYPKLMSLLEPEKEAVSQSQDLDVPLQTPNGGQSPGVYADGDHGSASTNPEVIQDAVENWQRSTTASDTDVTREKFEDRELSALKLTVRSLQSTLNSLREKEKNLEKKFSIIVYGVSECPEGTSKPDQSSHDFGEVASFLLKVDSSIQPQSIKDMHRLGKYHHERPRPRPILVKFLRSTDVFKVLVKRSLIQHPYSVKPYLSKEEQRCESALLKERWSLIQSGTSRESIKIHLKDGVIMVDSKLHGKWDSTTSTLTKPAHNY